MRAKIYKLLLTSGDDCSICASNVQSRIEKVIENPELI